VAAEATSTTKAGTVYPFIEFKKKKKILIGYEADY
jgi:hypothetical protein